MKMKMNDGCWWRKLKTARIQGMEYTSTTHSGPGILKKKVLSNPKECHKNE